MTPIARLRLDDRYPQTSEITVQFEQAEGPITVRVPWTSGDVRAALRDMFCLPPHERITAIEIGTLGITARIARTAPPQKAPPQPRQKGRPTKP